jgi:LmbE family N-acetylglucosaminyl deacetylase
MLGGEILSSGPIFRNKRVLVLAPHTDDAGLGCGGTISRMTEEGAELFISAFSTGDKSLPVGKPRRRPVFSPEEIGVWQLQGGHVFLVNVGNAEALS